MNLQLVFHTVSDSAVSFVDSDGQVVCCSESGLLGRRNNLFHSCYKNGLNYLGISVDR